MKSIVLIIPYFGRLPDFFPVWKLSALNNPTVDFLFCTDNDALHDEKNIKVVHLSFSDFRTLIQNKFSFPISLKKPYKLCDYKPSYGYVLSKYIKQYDFWGHCDIDLIFGDIRKFITDEILQENQKILEHGHFTLYRNDERTNTIFLRCAGYDDYDYEKAYTSDNSMYFDEFLGTQLIFRKEKIPTYLNRKIFFDVLPGQKPFQHIEPYAGKVIFRYADGRLYAEEQMDTTESRSTELMYAHFQKRKIDCSRFNAQSSFYIVPNRLFVSSKAPVKNWFVCRGTRAYRWNKEIQHVVEYLKRYRQGNFSSFRAYRAARTQFRNDMIGAKQEILEYGQN